MGVEYYNSKYDRYRIGTELWIQNFVALRGRYRINYEIEDYSFGFSVFPVFDGL